ncbi:alpha beta-hydrolase [Boletus edulis BED1]|uniref:Alpha beta-hydrolase n=1 Tax=Boletus edulis BED1 TaxID=1328754 RepID=A0AAD4BX90_BOLED|nr:alpha beta-hydrolase [Boletus edulis BED1]
MATLYTSTWGDPTAIKHVLLIHGMMASSQTWHRIAQEFASRGYFVTAPDLLGHGHARRSSDYTIAALAKELEPLFATSDRPFDIIIGMSLGGVIAPALLPLLKSKSTRPVHVVLVDPPLEQTPEQVAYYRKRFGDTLRNPKTPEAYLEDLPVLTKEEAIFFALSVRLCDVAAMDAIFDQNVPWSFAHLLETVPDYVKVTLLAADPSKVPCARVEDVKPYPHVIAKTVWGSSHLIPLEAPMVIVETALEGTEVQN